MRLFVAVDLPEAVKGSLDAAVGPLRKTLPRARWARPAGYHLTLAFLGEIGSEFIPAISKALREKLEQESGFRGHFGALGTFPNSGAMRTVWVGLEPAVRFQRLAELAQDGLRSSGIPYDEKTFRSHVTLARCDPPWPGHVRTEISVVAEGLGERLAGLFFACDRVTLFSSVLGPGGPAYRAEGAFPLQAP